MPSVMLSLKLLFISTTVLSAAVALKFSVPVVADFAVYELPSIYNLVLSWLQPPYLYLVINCIIITILASSKLQSKADDVPPPVTAVKSSIETDHFATAPIIYHYNDALVTDSVPFEAKEEKVMQDFGAVYEQVDSRGVNRTVSFADDGTSNKENECFVAKSNKTKPLERKDTAESSPKPPASARFGHRKTVRANPEGGKTVLGISKPKKQDTLESTWKTITEGRAVPLTRHLRKSDTWERDNRPVVPQEEKKTPQKMTKSETFNDRTNTRSTSPAGSNSSGGSGKVRKEPSLSQDELNRRVEAFIKKFNEDMRMQRQESLNQYKQMVNRGSR